MRVYVTFICLLFIRDINMYNLMDTVDFGDMYGNGGNGINEASDSGVFEWDSSLYGKPICVKVPSNMTLCKNMNYPRMKMPNLLGHDTIEEIVYQSSVWLPLLSINCHRDAQLFLCSMFAPVCVAESQAQTIYPCRSLCEAVKNSCEAKMLAYNYPWPSMFNCSRLPQDNGLCIQLSANQDQARPVSTPVDITTTITTTTSSSSSLTTRRTSSSTNMVRYRTTTNTNPNLNPLIKDINLSNNGNTCHGCHADEFSMEKLVTLYCNSDMALRGRIQSIKISNLDLTQNQQLGRRRMRKNETTSSSKQPTLRSLYIRVTKRDRKVLKGGFRFLPNDEALRSYFNENTAVEAHSADEMDIYLMSNVHLWSALNEMPHKNSKKIRNVLNDQNRRVGSGRSSRRPAHPLRRLARFQSNNSSSSNHCVCDKLRNTPRRANSKYLILANVLRSRTLHLSHNRTRMLKYKMRRNQHDLDVPRHQQQQHIKLIYLTGIFNWNRSRAFIDYLENDSVDKKDMCRNIKKSVKQIYKAKRMLF